MFSSNFLLCHNFHTIIQNFVWLSCLFHVMVANIELSILQRRKRISLAPTNIPFSFYPDTIRIEFKYSCKTNITWNLTSRYSSNVIKITGHLINGHFRFKTVGDICRYFFFLQLFSSITFLQMSIDWLRFSGPYGPQKTLCTFRIIP